MRSIQLIQSGCRLAAATALAAALLLSGDGTAAADEEFEPPTNILNTSLEPNCMNITWAHSTSGVDRFTVERAQPFGEGVTIWPPQKSHHSCGMQPGSPFHVEVCAYFSELGAPPEEEEKACAEGDFGTPPAQAEAPPPQQLSGPTIVASNSGPDWLDLTWEAGYDYDWYYINYALGQDLKTLQHKDDGTWGYQRIDGLLPGRIYTVEVQGCVSGIFENPCSGWGPRKEITTTGLAAPEVITGRPGQFEVPPPAGPPPLPAITGAPQGPAPPPPPAGPPIPAITGGPQGSGQCGYLVLC